MYMTYLYTYFLENKKNYSCTSNVHDHFKKSMIKKNTHDRKSKFEEKTGSPQLEKHEVKNSMDC